MALRTNILIIFKYFLKFNDDFKIHLTHYRTALKNKDHMYSYSFN